MGGRRAARDVPLRGVTRSSFQTEALPVDRNAERKGEERQVRVPAGPVTLDGDLRLRAEARGIVLFAHGSGSGRHSPRNRYVATLLNQAKLATLLVDLLTPEEEAV